MAEKVIVQGDPWEKLAARKGVRQLRLGEVLPLLSVDSRSAQALKKALLARVTRITRGG